jgi:hypothetical protein
MTASEVQQAESEVAQGPRGYRFLKDDSDVVAETSHQV